MIIKNMAYWKAKTDYLTKDKSRGPWEKENKLTKKQRQERERAIEVDHNVGAKMDGARDFLRLESVKRGKIKTSK